jgi:hypothetical protein
VRGPARGSLALGPADRDVDEAWLAPTARPAKRAEQYRIGVGGDEAVADPARQARALGPLATTMIGGVFGGSV